MIYVPSVILITGTGGFILSHVADEILAKWPECRVIGYDIMDYCASHKNMEESKATGRFDFVEGDIQDADKIASILAKYGVDTIVHGCAVSHVDNSYGDPLSFTRINTLGTQNLLECASKHSGIRRIIIVSTDEVYGSNTHQCDESSPLNPTNPYSASKAAMEQIVKSYINGDKMPIIVTRGNNVMGERQFPEKLIPKFIELLKRGEKLPIHGTGGQRRSYMYVKDVATAFIAIIEKGELYETYNIEAGDELSVIEVTEKILVHMGIDRAAWPNYFQHVEDRKFNDQRYFISGSKLRSLGWEPQYNFDDALDKTVKWYKDNDGYWPSLFGALRAHCRINEQ